MPDKAQGLRPKPRVVNVRQDFFAGRRNNRVPDLGAGLAHRTVVVNRPAGKCGADGTVFHKSRVAVAGRALLDTVGRTLQLGKQLNNVTITRAAPHVGALDSVDHIDISRPVGQGCHWPGVQNTAIQQPAGRAFDVARLPIDEVVNQRGAGERRMPQVCGDSGIPQIGVRGLHRGAGDRSQS